MVKENKPVGGGLENTIRTTKTRTRGIYDVGGKTSTKAGGRK